MSGGTTLGALRIPVVVDGSTIPESARAAGKTAEKSLEAAMKGMDKIGSQLTKFVTLPILGAGAAAVKFGLDFNKAMTESVAIMGTVSKEMRSKLEKTALDVSKSTKFSAAEAAAGYYELASAGLNAAQSMQALPFVAKFAQAGVMDLAESTKALANAQSSLGMKSADPIKNLENMTRVGNVLVDMANAATGSVQEFADALNNKAAAAGRAAGKSLEETAAVLATFAEKGRGGLISGEMFSIIINQIGTKAMDAKGKVNEFYNAVFDGGGKMRNVADIIEFFEKKTSKMSDAQRAAYFDQIKITEALRDNILTLTGSSGRIREFEERFQKVGDVVGEVSAKQMEAFSNKLAVIKNKLAATGIEAFNQLAPTIENQVLPALDKLAGKMSQTIQNFAQADSFTQRYNVTTVAFVAALGPALVMIPKIAAAMKALGVVSLTAGAYLAAIVAVIYALVQVWANWDNIVQGMRDSGGVIQGYIDGWKVLAQEMGIAGWTDRLVEKMEAMYRGVTQWWDRMLGYLVDKAKPIMDALIHPFDFAYETLVGHSIVPDMVQEIEANLEAMRAKSGTLSQAATDSIIEAWRDAKVKVLEEQREMAENQAKAAAKGMGEEEGATYTAAQSKISDAAYESGVKNIDDSIRALQNFDTLEMQYDRVKAFLAEASGIFDTIQAKAQATGQVIDQELLDQAMIDMYGQFYDQIGQDANKAIPQLNRMGSAMEKAVGKAMATQIAKTEKEMMDVDKGIEVSRKSAQEIVEPMKELTTSQYTALRVMGDMQQLVGALPGKFQKVGSVAQAGMNIAKIAIEGTNPALMALDIGIQLVTTAFGLFGEEGEKQLSNMDKMVEDLDQALTDFGSRFTDELVSLIRTGKAQWSDFADYVIEELLRITLQYAITEPLMAGVRSLYGSMFASGAAFSGGQVMAFAGGGIVNAPTVFPMARGYGLMGEAGPEAIMPLKRGADGKLGVQASGGNTIVTVHNYSGAEATVNETYSANGDREVQVMIRRSVERSIGYGELDGSMAANYGVARRAAIRR